MNINTVHSLVLLIGAVLPLLVGLVTKAKAPSGLKAVLLALFSAISGALSTLTIDDTKIVWSTLGTNIALTWLTAVATHYGLYKHLGNSGAGAALAPNFGLGQSEPPAVTVDVPVTIPETTVNIPVETPAVAEIADAVASINVESSGESANTAP